MKIRAKVFSKYLDQLLSGEKTKEFRQFESMILTDENGREAEFDISSVIKDGNVYADLKLRKQYPDVPWIDGKKIYTIYLGKRIK